MNSNNKFLIFLFATALCMLITLPMSVMEDRYVSLLNDKVYDTWNHDVYGFEITWNQTHQAQLEKVEADIAQILPLWVATCILTVFAAVYYLYPFVGRLRNT